MMGCCRGIYVPANLIVEHDSESAINPLRAEGQLYGSA